VQVNNVVDGERHGIERGGGERYEREREREIERGEIEG